MSKRLPPNVINQNGQTESASNENLSFGPFRLSISERTIKKAGIPLDLGSRAFDVLMVLVENAGSTVTKNDLLARVWPGVAADESNLRVQVAALRKALGDGKEGSRYVVTLTGQGYCFVAPISSEATSSAPTTAERPRNLPARLSRMVGRDQIVREISGRLIIDRLVTIAGPGGIGKTTVAVSIGHELLPEFAGVVQFVDLGSVGGSGLVLGAIASTLGLRQQSSDPVSDLIGFLRDKRMLLILDSCEHVIETAAAVVERILTDTTNVCILATSRESLRIEGEHVHRLQPLGSPPEGFGLTAAQALGFPSVQLFVERVAASGSGFILSDDDAPIVGEICRKLDGIALAIELAAGRVHAYGIRETMVSLNDRFRLLWQGRRTALPRHQTLHATLDWSYGLLHRKPSGRFSSVSRYSSVPSGCRQLARWLSTTA